MKFVIHYSLFIILFLLIFPNIGNTETGPKLVCDQPVYQFGNVDQSAVVTNIFIIRNEGDMTVVVGKPRSACGCTTVRLSKQMIGPGETAELTAVFTAKGQAQRQKKPIYLPSADSPKLLLTLYLEGFVEPPSDLRGRE